MRVSVQYTTVVEILKALSINKPQKYLCPNFWPANS